jgi:hypothetical protein
VRDPAAMNGFGQSIPKALRPGMGIIRGRGMKPLMRRAERLIAGWKGNART